MQRKSLLSTMKKMMVFGILFYASAFSITARASEADILTRIEALKVKFPQGKYWNHVGSSTDNVDGWTDVPCTCHGVSGVSHIYGTGGCTCNHYYDTVQTSHNGSTQCMGFANKAGYDVFGATTWTVYSGSSMNIANIKVGDIIRMKETYSEHSVFVIAKNGNIITVGEGNYYGKCMISWDRTIDLSKAVICYYEHADNYDTITGGSLIVPGTGGSPVPEEPVTPGGLATPGTQTEAPVDNSFSGWKKAADDEHYQYYKSGKPQKGKWLTLSKKKYYLDKQGYRVTGLYKIGANKYYFNSKGVLQKKKWVTCDGLDYYVGSSGFVLKKQWLYKKNTLVYVKKDGAKAENELVKIGSRTYCFMKNGKRSKGFHKIKGKTYYSNRSGVIQKKKWLKVKGKKYYLQKNGARAENTLLTIGKFRYYFNSKGVMQTSKYITLGDKTYRADGNGHCVLWKIKHKIPENDDTTPGKNEA